MARKSGTANKRNNRKPIEELDYEYQYGADLENRRDIIQGNASKTRIFCLDCKKYYMEGKAIRNRNGCRGNELEWAVCPYRKIALEVIKYG